VSTGRSSSAGRSRRAGLRGVARLPCGSGKAGHPRVPAPGVELVPPHSDCGCVPRAWMRPVRAPGLQKGAPRLQHAPRRYDGQFPVGKGARKVHHADPHGCSLRQDRDQEQDRR
jgi:hypothetical protein